MACNLCGAQEFIPLYNEKSDLNSTLELALVKCSSCGLMFVDPQPPEEMKGWLRLPDLNERIFVTQGDYKYGVYWYLCRWIQKYFNYPSLSQYRLLDIGCGIGEFVKYCADLGWVGMGVEPAPAQANFARQRGLNIYQGYFDSVAKEAERYNIITLLDVLEHVNNPFGLLKKVYNSVEPNTLLVIRVPFGPFQLIRANFFKYFLGKNYSLLGSKDHIFQFSDRTLKKMLEKAGFKVLKIEPSVYETTRRNNRVLNIIKRIFILIARLYNYIFGGIISNSMVIYAVK